MVKSGISITQEILDTFNDFKFHKKYDFVVLRVGNNKKTLEVVHAPLKGSYTEVQEFSPEASDSCGQHAPDKYKYFYELITEEGNCGYGFYLFEYKKREGGVGDDLSFFSWVPDSCQPTTKMLYSSTKDEIRKKLEGIGTQLQLSDKKDFDYREIILDKVDKNACFD